MPRKIINPATLAHHEKNGTVPAVTLPETGFVRLSTVLRVFPVSRSTWWQGVKTHRYPAPVKLGPNTTAWKAEDIRALLAQYQQPQG
jgi:prophage regulatory protein